MSSRGLVRRASLLHQPSNWEHPIFALVIMCQVNRLSLLLIFTPSINWDESLTNSFLISDGFSIQMYQFCPCISIFNLQVSKRTKIYVTNIWWSPVDSKSYLSDTSDPLDDSSSCAKLYNLHVLTNLWFNFNSFKFTSVKGLNQMKKLW